MNPPKSKKVRENKKQKTTEEERASSSTLAIDPGGYTAGAERLAIEHSGASFSVTASKVESPRVRVEADRGDLSFPLPSGERVSLFFRHP